ncbi:MAG: CinY protein [Rhizomicrobium sp.]|jgi:hypothetical protein
MTPFARGLFIGGALALICGGPAFAFGTIVGMGQNAEHQRITRHALACSNSTTDCFEPESLEALAGGKAGLGAVGIPDRGDLMVVNKMHCDGGDWLDVPGYPQSKNAAQAALEACRAWMHEKLADAVRDAGKLMNDENNVRQSQIALPCTFAPQFKGNVKCTVIEDFGILLHASQDFYSRTNWVDRADPSQPSGPKNVPGLAQTGRARWLDLRADAPFPQGLISGCFEKVPEERGCNYGEGLMRAKRLYLNKDMGTIDPEIGKGTTPRGLVADNFAHAVEAAIDDTRDKWATLEEQLVATYGDQQGARMACVITHDRPLNACP